MLGAEMLVVGKKAESVAEGRERLLLAIARGDGARVMERLVEAQGGDPRVVADPSRLRVADVVVSVISSEEGFVTHVDALAIGLAAVAMGAGRTRVDQKIDPAVGISILAKPGAPVRRGHELAQLHVRSVDDGEKVAERVRAAFQVGRSPPAPKPLVRGRLE